MQFVAAIVLLFSLFCVYQVAVTWKIRSGANKTAWLLMLAWMMYWGVSTL